VTRRELILLLGGGAAAAMPVASLAQRSEVKARVGFLSPGPRGSPDDRESNAFFDELAHHGYVEGRNLEVLFEVFGEAPDRLPEFAAALVGAGVDVIVAQGPEAAVRAARAAADAIPIVVVAINYDPIERGDAASLAHPGGNVTGVFYQSLELAGKQVELLKAIVPEATRLTVLWGAETADEFAAAESAAKTLGLVTRSFKLGAPPYDYDAVFRSLAEDAPQLVLVLSTPAFAGHHSEVAAAACVTGYPRCIASAPMSRQAD
jgi:putative tryptophan/tyrosine transport system substrate-binding protein